MAKSRLKILLHVFAVTVFWYGFSCHELKAQALEDIEYVDDLNNDELNNDELSNDELSNEELKNLGIDEEESEESVKKNEEFSLNAEEEKLTAFEDESEAEKGFIEGSADFIAPRVSALESLILTPIDISLADSVIKKKWRRKLWPLQRIIFKSLKKQAPLKIKISRRPYILGKWKNKALRENVGLVLFQIRKKTLYMKIISSQKNVELAQWQLKFPRDTAKKGRRKIVIQIVRSLVKAIPFDGFLTKITGDKAVATLNLKTNLKRGDYLEILEFSPEGLILQKEARRRGVLKIMRVDGKQIHGRLKKKDAGLKPFMKVRLSKKSVFLFEEKNLHNKSWWVQAGVKWISIDTFVDTSELSAMDYHLETSPFLQISLGRGSWLGRGLVGFGNQSSSSSTSLNQKTTFLLSEFFYTRPWRKGDEYFINWQAGLGYDVYSATSDESESNPSGLSSLSRVSPLFGGVVTFPLWPKTLMVNEFLLGWPIFASVSGGRPLESYSFGYRAGVRLNLERGRFFVGGIRVKKIRTQFMNGKLSELNWGIYLSFNYEFQGK